MVQRDRILRLVALFKFTKAALLVTTGLGALHLLDPGFAARAVRWSAALASAPGLRVFGDLLTRAVGLPPGRLEILGIGALLYAALFATEGTGLWLGRRWAEYLTLVATASFVPLEIIGVARHSSTPPLAALVLNLLVVAYLWSRIRRRTRPGRPPDARIPLAGQGHAGLRESLGIEDRRSASDHSRAWPRLRRAPRP